MSHDFYELLGVSRTTSADDIKKAYRKLAMQHHPDRNPGDKEAERKFKEISHAYDILKDPEKRAAYDRYGAAAFEGGAGPGGPFQGGQGFDFGSVFGDIFEEMFGANGARGRGRADTRGQDLRFNLEITLEDAFNGKTAALTIPISISCEPCSGTGAKAGTKAKTCTTCNGAGTVHMRQGFFSIQQTCPHCHGSGKIIPEPCTSCNGAGKIKRQKTLEVKIPAGIGEGMRIRSAGNGEPGTNGGPAGDLYIEIRVKDHDIFERDGDDLHCTVPVSFTTVALGGSIEVPTLAGKAEIELPEGTQHGKTFRLRGKGIKGLRSSYPGDLYAHVSVETPVKLTEHQRKLLKELDEALKKGGEKHSPNAKSWTDRVKDLFK